MKIVIINENPAVSRLATLALDKIGLEYAQIGNAGELDGPCDVLIVDSDSDAKDTNLKQFANKILYLSSKNAPTFEGADRILPKPFLPTEFIAIVEDLASKSKEAANEAKAEAQDDEVSVKGFEFMDDLGDEIFKEEPAPIDADEFDLEGILDDDPVLSGDEAAGFEEPGDTVKSTEDASQEPESKADEPNFDESEADNDKFEDTNEQEALGELDDFEIAVKEEDFNEFDLEGILDDDPVLSGDEAAGFEEPGETVKPTDDASQEPESKADEPNFDESEADNDKFEDTNEQEALGELDDFEIAVKEEDFNGLDLDDESVGEIAEQNESQEAKFEAFGDSIEDIKNQIDEIDAMDEEAFEATSDESEAKDAEDADERFVELDAKPNDTGFENSQEPGVELASEDDKESQISISDEAAQEYPKDAATDDEIKFEENKEQEIKDEILDDADFLVDDTDGEALDEKNEEPKNDENLTQEILDGEVTGEDFAADEQAQALTSGDQAGPNEEKEAQSEPVGAVEFDAEGYSQIEQISEKDMALALNESGYDVSEVAEPQDKSVKIDEIKAQISDAVTKNLEASLQNGELREALKNLNIRISISFEEK